MASKTGRWEQRAEGKAQRSGALHYELVLIEAVLRTSDPDRRANLQHRKFSEPWAGSVKEPGQGRAGKRGQIRRGLCTMGRILADGQWRALEVYEAPSTRVCV